MMKSVHLGSHARSLREVSAIDLEDEIGSEVVLDLVVQGLGDHGGAKIGLWMERVSESRRGLLIEDRVIKSQRSWRKEEEERLRIRGRNMHG